MVIGWIESRPGCGLVPTVGEFLCMSVCSSVEKGRLCLHRSIRFIFPELGSLDGRGKRQRLIREAEGWGARTLPCGLVRIRGEEVLRRLTVWHVTIWLVGRFFSFVHAEKKRSCATILASEYHKSGVALCFLPSFGLAGMGLGWSITYRA
ncbi:MAG: hypothetical protein JOS17DRAFT_484287 [Linnemannia elongata]|nr:MAG: hypothetical protein JOS17DRAFT_484287 [Linnemannia elongata]